MSDVKRNVLCKAGRKKSSVVSSSSICRIISDELLAGLVAVDRQAAGTVKKIKNKKCTCHAPEEPYKFMGSKIIQYGRS